MKINIHETLMNLNRGRISVDQAHDEIESAMCEANACPQLYEGWRDARKELPIKCEKIIVAMTNGTNRWVRESTFDSYTKCFIDDRMDDIESVNSDGEKLVWVYAWRTLPDPPAFV